MNERKDVLEQLVGKVVVLDAASRFVYVGILEGGDHHYFILTDADVHDLRDTNTNRELYVLESKQHGVRSNRKRVLVRRDEIVSLSALDDVFE